MRILINWKSPPIGMESQKIEGLQEKNMRILINWKSPPQKGNREPSRWGLPGLL